MAVGLDASGSVTGLIIDASIPAGARHAAANIAGEGRRREGRRGGGGGIGANKRRHLECCSAGP